jgi:uracil-DNA glycosylase family 4
MSYDTRNPCCNLCRRFRPCLGTGPTPSSILFLGEGPGETEDWKRVPFIGPAGRELNFQYLPLSGLTREDVYVTNAMKCRQGKKDGDDPDPKEVLTCALHHLPGELARVRPNLIVTLGAHALRLFGNHALDMHHGRPLFNQKFCQWEGTVFPIYHPAAGLRQSQFLIDIQADFRALRLYRYGKLTLPVDQHPNPDYRHLRTQDDFLSVLRAANSHHGGDWMGAPWAEIAIDTETDMALTPAPIWCLTFSLVPGTGYMIRADNPDLLHHFRTWLHDTRPLTIYHNYLFDAAILAQVDIATPRFMDTMQEAFQVGTLPQALKVLAFRYLGMEMHEYDDVVMPYAHAEAIGYLDLGSKTVLEGFVEALPWKHKKMKCSGGKQFGGKHESTVVEVVEPGETPCPVCGKPKKSGEMERDKGGRQFIWDRCQKILDDVMEKASDPIKRWDKVSAEERAVVEAVIGTMPRPSIAQVPFEEAVWYACRDSDATLRIKPVIRREARVVGRAVRR